MNCKVVLIKSVPGLGKKGELLEVKKGYARNSLIPQGVAKIVEPSDAQKIEKQILVHQEIERQQSAVQLAQIENIKQKLAKKRVSLKKPAASTGTLYASISTEDIIDAIFKTYGVNLPAESIKIKSIKSIGLHNFEIDLKDKGRILMKLKVIGNAI